MCTRFGGSDFPISFFRKVMASPDVLDVDTLDGPAGSRLGGTTLPAPQSPGDKPDHPEARPGDCSRTRKADRTARAGGRTGEMNGIGVVLLLLLTVTVAGCEAIGTIFEAGIWVGVIMVALVLLVVGFVAAKLRRTP
jgi:hypothetical protein